MIWERGPPLLLQDLVKALRCFLRVCFTALTPCVDVSSRGARTSNQTLLQEWSYIKRTKKYATHQQSTSHQPVITYVRHHDLSLRSQVARMVVILKGPQKGYETHHQGTPGTMQIGTMQIHVSTQLPPHHLTTQTTRPHGGERQGSGVPCTQARAFCMRWSAGGTQTSAAQWSSTPSSISC